MSIHRVSGKIESSDVIEAKLLGSIFVIWGLDSILNKEKGYTAVALVISDATFQLIFTEEGRESKIRTVDKIDQAIEIFNEFVDVHQ
jgi:hypothetical protein